MTGNEKTGAEGERTAALREAIRRAFPVVEHTGKITRHDGVWLPELTEENAIYDDDMLVYEALKGRTWPDVQKSFLCAEPDGFVLLTDEALIAFLAAWLMHSLEDMDGENIVREFIVYAFSPSHDMVPDLTDSKISQIRALNPGQRAVLRSLLAEFAEREASPFVRKLAGDAVELIDSLEPWTIVG